MQHGTYQGAMKHRIQPATVMAAVALFFSLTGAGLAAQHYLITNVHQIKPSVRHALRGHQGPRGSQGPAGAQGPAGSSTPVDWTNNVRFSDQVFTSADGSSATALATCPDGQQPITGGYSADHGIIVTTNMVLLPNEHPEHPTQWQVIAHQAPDAPAAFFQAWVVCEPSPS